MRVMVFALVVMFALQAHAADDVTVQAKKAFQAGTTAFDAKKYDEALADYEEAYRLKPLPGFLFNIGLCHRKLGHHDLAATFFERFLNAEPKAKNKADVQAMLDEERRLASPKPDVTKPAPTPPTPTATPATTTTPTAAPLQPDATPAATTTPEATPGETKPAETDNATPWIVGGGVGVVVAAVAATAVVVMVATSKPAPIGTIDLRGATP